MFMKNIFIEIIIIVLLVSTLPVIICTNNCTIYGDPPRPSTPSLNSAAEIVDFCLNFKKILLGPLVQVPQLLPLTGTVLQFKDNNGEQRAACLITKESTKQLPLLVWLHPSLVPRNAIIATGLLPAMTNTDLTNDPSRLGYHLLIISGRSTTHFYPFPDDVGLGWDNWYRNYDRSHPEINVDVQTIDHFISESVLQPNVDRKRIYMSGWSNGAAMAVQYGLNTPNIAAVAVYSAPDPYGDVDDPCKQDPKPPYLTPFKILSNQCDIIGICTTGKAFVDGLKDRYPDLTAEFIVTNAAQLYVVNSTECNDDLLLCDEIIIGGFNHIRWPIVLNHEFFNFLKKYESN